MTIQPVVKLGNYQHKIFINFKSKIIYIKYEPQSDVIYINDQDIWSVGLSHLRDKISIVELDEATSYSENSPRLFSVDSEQLTASSTKSSLPLVPFQSKK